jgi:tetratricopeptide (TPR) repeat protein
MIWRKKQTLFRYICLMGIKSVIVAALLVVSQLCEASSLESIDSVKTILPQMKGTDRFSTLLKLSESYRTLSFYDCIDYGQEAVDLAESLKDDTLQALALKSLGNSCYYLGELDLARDYYRKALAYYSLQNHLQGQSNCLNNLGLVFDETSDFDSARYYYQMSYNLEKLIGNEIGMGTALIQLGNVFYYINEFQSALDHYYQAMLIFKETGDNELLARCYNSLGIIYRAFNQQEKSLEYYAKAIAILEATGDERSLSQVLNNAGEIYNFDLKDYKKALNLYEQSLKLKEKLNDKLGIALLNNNMGTLYANMENFNAAIKYFYKSIKQYKELQSETGLVMALYNTGSLYLQEMKIDSAIPYLSDGLNMAEKNNYVDYISLCQESLMHCYAYSGNIEEYNKYFNAYILSKDSLIQTLHLLQSQQTETKYRIEEINHEAEVLAQLNREKEEDLHAYKLLLIGMGAFVFLLVLVYALFNKKRKPA